MGIFKKLRSNKGLTGADIASAITVIVLTVGIVTGIYINTINKSKNNLRYANATRIATSIMEGIERKTYDEVLAAFVVLNEDEEEVNVNSITVANDGTIFDAKIISGFSATVTIGNAGTPDIARDITVSVRYKTSTTYRTITLTTVKEREMLDLTNDPDLSLIPGYNPSSTDWYYYPVIRDGSTYKVTTFEDINWFNYESGKYALIWKSNSGTVTTGATANSGDIYAWIPRFVAKSSGAGTAYVKFLYGKSDYTIDLLTRSDIIFYGKGTTQIASAAVASTSDFGWTGFASGDGLSGVWYKIGGGADNDICMVNSSVTVRNIAIAFNNRVACSYSGITIN